MGLIAERLYTFFVESPDVLLAYEVPCSALSGRRHHVALDRPRPGLQGQVECQSEERVPPRDDGSRGHRRVER